MAILIESKTHDSEKNRWSTTWPCFDDAVRLRGRPFALDVAAEPLTAKCARFYASKDFFDAGRLSAFGVSGGDTWQFNDPVRCVGFDALELAWDNDWWCNPPFDLKVPFLEHAATQWANRRFGMMLLPYEPLSEWWRKLVNPVASCVYEPDGRYAFYETDGYTQKTGVNFGSVLVDFSEHNRKPNDLLPRVPFIRYRLSRLKLERAQQLEQLRVKHLYARRLQEIA